MTQAAASAPGRLFVLPYALASGLFCALAFAAASFAGKLPARRSLAVELCGIYWHFVDIVWIVIFTLVYLLEGVSGA